MLVSLHLVACHLAGRSSPQPLHEKGQLVGMSCRQRLDEVRRRGWKRVPLDHSEPQPAHDFARIGVEPLDLAGLDVPPEDLSNTVQPVGQHERQERIVRLLAQAPPYPTDERSLITCRAWNARDTRCVISHRPHRFEFSDLIVLSERALSDPKDNRSGRDDEWHRARHSIVRMELYSQLVQTWHQALGEKMAAAIPLLTDE